LDGTTGVNGVFDTCALFGAISVNGDFHTADSFSGVPGGGAGEIDVSAATNWQGQFRRYTGGLNVYGMETGDVASFDMLPGVIRFKSDCTGGEAKVRGLGEPIEVDGTLDILDDDGYLTAASAAVLSQIASDTAKARKLLGNRQETVDTGATVVLRTWDDDGTTILEENILTKADDSKPEISEGVAKRGVPS
jgi:hypothetical protein